MKKLWQVGILLALTAVAAAATAPPPELRGIWATDGAEFKGDAIWNGSALYLDSDGVGALVGGDGTDVLGVRVVFVSYNTSTHELTLNLTEYGKVTGSAVMIFMPAEQVLSSPKKPGERYHRRTGVVSAEIRKSLGLGPQVP